MPARGPAAIVKLAGGFRSDPRLRRAARARDGRIAVPAASIVRRCGRQIAGAVRLKAAMAGVLLAVGLTSAATAENLEGVWHGTYWGETSDALVRHFRARALALPQSIDFG